MREKTGFKPKKSGFKILTFTTFVALGIFSSLNLIFLIC